MSLSVLIQVTHLLGAGHLTRAAALASACAGRGHEVTLLSGGMPHKLIQQNGFEMVQVPAVKIEGAAFTRLLTPEGVPVDGSYLASRLAGIQAAVRQSRPDVLVTELFPFGRRVLADEFLATIAAVRDGRKPTAVLASIRDILATPSRPARVTETEERLETLYDAVLVHGDPGLVPLDASWPVSERVKAKLRYTGYIDNPAPPESPRIDASDIVVSGGSSAASLPLYRAAIGAAVKIPRSWRILVGNGVNATDFEALVMAAPANAVVERARPDFQALLEGAALSVSQCGYNTALDVLGPKLRRLFVPFEGEHETEQLLRAKTLTERGAACVLRERDLSAARLAAMIARLLDEPPPPLVRFARNGAAISAEIIETLPRSMR